MRQSRCAPSWPCTPCLVPTSYGTPSLVPTSLRLLSLALGGYKLWACFPSLWVQALGILWAIDIVEVDFLFFLFSRVAGAIRSLYVRGGDPQISQSHRGAHSHTHPATPNTLDQRERKNENRSNAECESNRTLNTPRAEAPPSLALERVPFYRSYIKRVCIYNTGFG